MKKILVFIFTGIVSVTSAQQLQTSSMYEMQGTMHNPSVAGVQESNMIGVSYRTQWSGISGSPKTATVFGSFKLPRQQMGLGGYVYNDRTGPTSRTGIVVSLAKHINTNSGTFSLGIESKFLQYALDRSKLTNTLGDDPVLAGSDNRFKYDAGFGVSYTSKRFQLGASVSQLVQTKLNFYKGNMSVSEEARLYRHYFFHGLYNWDVDGATVITPNALVIYLPNAPLDFQVSARVEHKKLFWWGVGYRGEQSFMLSAGLHIQKKFTIGYAYDHYRTPVSHFEGGTGAHELMLRFNFVK